MTRWIVILSMALVFGFALTAAAQQPTPARPQTEQEAAAALASVNRGSNLVRQAYQKTKTARYTKEFSEIIDLCQEALRIGIKPEDVAYADQLMAWAHNRRGEEHAAAKRTTDALTDFSTAVALDPTLWRAWHNRGVSMALVNNYDDAIKDFNKALDLHQAYPNTWFNRGEIFYQKGEFEKAINDYTQAIKLSPRDGAILNSRGHALYRLGRVKESLADLDAAVNLSPQNAIVWLNRGDVFLDQGDYAQASRDYRQAIRLDPRLGRAYQSAAWLMATCPDQRFRDVKMALDSAKMAIQLDGKGDYRYLDTLAAAQANAGQFDEAILLQTQVIKMVTDNEPTQYQDRLKLYIDKLPFRESQKKVAGTGEPDRG